jgi:polar amino acid transport system permease protein
LLSGADSPFPAMFRRLMAGLQKTGQIVGMAMVGSVLWGIVLGVARVSRRSWINLPASIYVEIIRGIPLLVLLFMVYFGFNQFLPPGWKMNAFWAAVLGLCICYGAFMGEAVRAGIQAIPHEEIEAASLEAGRYKVLWYITLPRALRIILPAGANECIALLKDSSVVSILAISELTRSGQEYATSKFLFFETYAMVALIYLALTLMLSRAVRILEKSWMTT